MGLLMDYLELTNMKSKQEIIDEVMDYLDFEKIHNTMIALNLQWWNIDGVPEIYQIRQFLRKLLNELIDENLKEIQCGGFRVRKEHEVIIVTFEVESLEVEL